MKNNRSYLTHIISILLLGTTSFVQANGAYIGGTVGKTDLFGEITEGGSSLKFFAGYEINRNLAVEGSLQSLVSVQDEIYGDLYAGSLSIAALAKYPITPQFEIFGKIGATNTTILTQDLPFVNTKNLDASLLDDTLLLNSITAKDGTDSDTAKLFGIGANINYTPNMAIRAEYETTYLGDQEYSTSSIGLMYKTF